MTKLNAQKYLEYLDLKEDFLINIKASTIERQLLDDGILATMKAYPSFNRLELTAHFFHLQTMLSIFLTKRSFYHETP